MTPMAYGHYDPYRPYGHYDPYGANDPFGSCGPFMTPMTPYDPHGP